ncbi:MAG: BrnA antitoxin family protein [Alphaproteobacteria bacterium]|nr:BrnA antitoxin family protein [Alphaproteobacteria bacterium]
MTNVIMQQLFTMNLESVLKDYAAYRAFHKSDCIVNMRIPHQIIDKVKEISDTQHIPYQSLISSVLFALINPDEQPKKEEQ